ncbi:hypothetical protein [Pedobacter frigidisoli]|nr:hypothetical protein [Pedobacter frigidisoli]
MRIRVRSAYELAVDGSMQKVANKINVEARRDNLTLASNKKVVGQGGKSS